jgi:hypothetical protein
MRTTKTILFVLIISIIFFSCKRNPLTVDISNIDKEIEVVRFEKKLFSETDSLKSMVKLYNNYPDFFNLFTYKVINIGGINDEMFPDLMNRFLTDTMILNVKTMVEQEFDDFEKIENQLIKAFKYYQFHFPEKEIPTIYTCISGFNQSVFTAENIIGISLDKYLGKDCDYYKQLSTVPMYKTPNMHPEKIVSDVAYAWGVTEFEDIEKTTNLLANIIHQGKIMYFVDALLPEMHDTLKIGYTKEKLEWCHENEAQMWLYLVDKKMLYSNKRMDILRYINDGPTTTGFPLESPARTGIWLGWQIVRQYMKKNPETTVNELMENTNYQGILNDSGYFPE